MSGGPSGARTRKLALWVGGDEAIFERHKAVRIEYLTTGLQVGGAEKIVFELASGMKARGHDVSVTSLLEPKAYAESLRQQGIDVRHFPIAMQYNKQDLPRDLILTPEDLDEMLNFRGLKSFGADAIRGPGVFETLRAISELVLKRLAAGGSVG